MNKIGVRLNERAWQPNAVRMKMPSNGEPRDLMGRVPAEITDIVAQCLNLGREFHHTASIALVVGAPQLIGLAGKGKCGSWRIALAFDLRSRSLVPGGRASLVDILICDYDVREPIFDHNH